MKITLKVTQQHIRKGEPGEVDKCPIAICLREVLEAIDSGIDVYIDSISVTQDDIGFVMDGVEYNSVAMPKTASRFVNRFDEDGKKFVKPFAFQFEAKPQIPD